MRAVPIPDGVADAMHGERITLGEPGDPTRTDVRPCEYVITRSELYPGRLCYHALVTLEPAEREAIAAGHDIWLTLDGGEVPWALDVTGGA